LVLGACSCSLGKILREVVEKKNKQHQKCNHQQIPLLPTFEQWSLIVIGIHLFLNNEMAMKPNTIPISSPTLIRLINIPIAKPSTIAAIAAIFLLVMSAC